MTELLIKRIDPELPLPAYQTAGAAAFDLSSRLDVTLPPQVMTRVPLNTVLKVPVGHMTLLVARSSLHKKGLMLGNGIGIVDEDYCGDGDEFQALLFNFTTEPVQLAKGDRIVQALVLPVQQYAFKEVASMGVADRGGFGSTK